MSTARKPVKNPLFAAFDLMTDMIWIQGAQGRILEANSAATDQLGLSRERLLGKSIYDFYYDAKDRALGEDFCRRARQNGSADFIVSLRKSSGGVIEAFLRGSWIEYEGKRALLAGAREIGERFGDKRRALLVYQAFKQSNDVVFYCDRNGVILDINEAFTTHYGYSREEAIGKTPSILRSRHSTSELYRQMWRSILDSKKGYWRGEIINAAKDGREIPIVLTITAVKDGRGEIVGYISNAVDLTEQVALQGRVAQSEALATIGEMAAVVAHEIRNPLGSIVMAAKQISAGNLSAEDGALVRQVLNSESQRLNEALNNLLAYARPRETRFERGDLNALLGEVVNMVKSNPELIRDIKVRTRLAQELDPFPLDPGQMRQVMWNIVLNAIQAMGGRGVLTVETGRDKTCAFFRIRDTGPGIPKDSLGLIFKPFHTTKQQGTGLGLAIADRIVKAHGGRIEVKTKLEDGTTFSVYLPSVAG